MPDAARKWTREMVLALPEDGNRYELFDGALLVTPAPGAPHQMAIALLLEMIIPYVNAHGLGWTLTSPADLRLGSGQLSQPDLFVVPDVPADRSWGSFPLPTLLVEVISPASARFDRIVKRRRFQQAGVPEYWVVDLDTRIVERWRPMDERPEILEMGLTWHPEGATQSLTIDLPQFFAAVWGPP